MTSAGNVGDAIIVYGAGVLGTWVADFIREAYSLFAEPVEVQSSDGDAVYPDLGREGGPPRVLLVTGPGRAVMEAISTRRVPTVAVLDDPVDSMRVVMASPSSMRCGTARASPPGTTCFSTTPRSPCSSAGT